MLASDSGEMDSALFLLSLGVSLGLEKRDTADTQVSRQLVRTLHTIRDRTETGPRTPLSSDAAAGFRRNDRIAAVIPWNYSR